MKTKKLNINSNRVDESVNPNTAYYDNEQNNSRYEQNNSRYENRTRTNQQSLRVSRPTERRTGSSFKPLDTIGDMEQYTNAKPEEIKARQNKEDAIKSSLSKVLTEMEKAFGLREKTVSGKVIASLPVLEFHKEVMERRKGKSIALRRKNTVDASGALGGLQCVNNFMRYDHVLKLDFNGFKGLKEVVTVMERFKHRRFDDKEKLLELNLLLQALKQNDEINSIFIRTLAYRFVRLFWVFCVYGDFISASVLSEVILEQISLYQKWERYNSEKGKVKQNAIR